MLVASGDRVPLEYSLEDITRKRRKKKLERNLGKRKGKEKRPVVERVKMLKEWEKKSR